MKKFFASMVFVSAFALLSTVRALGDDLESLSGKWVAKKTIQGQSITQTIEIKKDKLTFEVKNSDGKTVLYAEAKIKLETLGSFKTMKAFDIKAGESSSGTESVDGSRTSIYQLSGGTWTMASNFDEIREEKPTVDVYTKE